MGTSRLSQLGLALGGGEGCLGAAMTTVERGRGQQSPPLHRTSHPGSSLRSSTSSAPGHRAGIAHILWSSLEGPLHPTLSKKFHNTLHAALQSL